MCCIIRAPKQRLGAFWLSLGERRLGFGQSTAVRGLGDRRASLAIRHLGGLEEVRHQQAPSAHGSVGKGVRWCSALEEAWFASLEQAGIADTHAGRQARENLELSFTAEAEMVFTTLSSTGRRIFARLPAPFETVLVDEAAQASEIAALQALAFECRRY